MPATPQALRARTQSLLRVLLLGAIVTLAALIAGGVVYIQRNPALSTYALMALAREPFLRMEFAGIAEAAPTGRNADSIPVLTYHRIVSDSSDVNNVSYSNFKDQMATLKRAGWETVTLEEFEAFVLGEKQLPEKSFVLTFDDGAKESFYPVDPILKILGYEAVNFIIVESSHIPHTTYYLTPREIERMLETGRWSIGSHSFDGHHPYPTDGHGGTGIFFADRIWKADEGRLETPEEFRERVRDDLVRSKMSLEAAYDVPINSFAFPLGNETGINGANNFPEGAIVTEEEARANYSFGHLQLANQHFTTNFPRTSSNPPHATPAEDFRVWRIHVDFDWDGKRVLQILENGRSKELPFEDDFSENRGWIPAWGELGMGRNNFVLRATPDTSAASAFLDGTAMWDNYSFDAAVNWQRGHAIVLADVVHSSTYHSCVFSPGSVRIQRTIDGVTETLVERADPRIQYGEVRVGVRVRGSVIECTWNFASMVENYSRDFTGGVGLQTWDEALGNAELRVSSVIARPFNGMDE
ncbi:MAG TPA: polysaccharide deacetylase family protein [Candidatus Paceibacterota bacterium]|nr:polysaccharide deacetylase family protein [Candidatus Paceibacterota bacterium]